jgi:hypothetical protein
MSDRGVIDPLPVVAAAFAIFPGMTCYHAKELDASEHFCGDAEWRFFTDRK